MPAETPDPYRVWLSEIMLQQTTVKTVAPYFARFTARWRDVRALAAAPLDDVLKLWAGLGYYARARNLHACAKAVVERHGGRFPQSQAELAALPGIGPYTAAAIAAIAFDAPAAAVDGNVERVVARLFAVETELPAAKAEIRRLTERAGAGRTRRRFRPRPDGSGRHHLHAEDAGLRALSLDAARAPRVAAATPQPFRVRAPKKTGRLRRGAAFVVVRADGCVLVRTRAPTGLLGGMTEVPTTEWMHDFEAGRELTQAPRLGRARPKWRRLPGVVTHVFTHFPLELIVYLARVRPDAAAPRGARWIARADLAGEALPNLMRKVLAHALG